MNFSEKLKVRVEKIEDIIKKYMPDETGYQRTVIEAMNYSILAGGKRLRPMLMLETFRLFGGDGEVIEPFMAAIEMIHTYSLVHDDLPAMDNDEYRRGRKTTHVVYGEAMGILAGDGLLNYAFETAVKAFDKTDDYKAVAKALKIFAQKTGIYGMIGGQTVDVENDGKPITKDMLDFIYELKTGALIEASMMTGAVLAGASDENIEKVKAVAINVGLAFQIQDDILDITSTMEVLGKPINSDEKNNKITYVSLEGLERAKHDVESVSNKALTLLDELEGNNEFLRELIIMLITRKK